MVWTTHLLVIANRTVDSDELHEELVARASVGPVDVTLLAPATAEPGGEGDARAATAQRLLDAVQNLRHAGVRVRGILGDPDPMLALDEVWDPRRFDEVVVVTLPRRTSRWLAADLPRRVERFTGARVTHVMAKSRGKVTV
jgi:hypothetical protein